MLNHTPNECKNFQVLSMSETDVLNLLNSLTFARVEKLKKSHKTGTIKTILFQKLPEIFNMCPTNLAFVEDVVKYYLRKYDSKGDVRNSDILGKRARSPGSEKLHSKRVKKME